MPRMVKNNNTKQCSSKLYKEVLEHDSENNKESASKDTKCRKIHKVKKQTKFNRDRRQTKKLVNQLQELIRKYKNSSDQQESTKAYYQLKKIMASSQPQYNKIPKTRHSKKNSYEKYCEKIIRNKSLGKYILIVRRQMKEETAQILDTQFWQKYQNMIQLKQETQSINPRDYVLQQIQSVNYFKDINISQDLIRILGQQVPQKAQNHRRKKSKRQFLQSIDKAQLCCFSQISAPLSAPQIQKDLLGNIDSYPNKNFSELKHLISQDVQKRLRCPSLIGSQISRFSNIIDIIDPKNSLHGDQKIERQQQQFFFEKQMPAKEQIAKQQIQPKKKNIGKGLSQQNWNKIVRYVSPKFKRKDSNHSI